MAGSADHPSANPKKQGPHGVAICVVRVVDVDYEYDPIGWTLADPRPVKHVPVLGKLLLWRVPDELTLELGLRLRA